METKDLFVVHSKREPQEEALVSRLVHWLDRLAISFYEYDDWTWDRREPGPPRYSSSGMHIDPVRFAMGHSEPFKHATWRDRADRDTIEELLARARTVLIIGPRGGSPSEGVYEELQILPSKSVRIVASWSSHNDWVVEHHRPGFTYNIQRTFDEEQAGAALDLAHVVWLHWFMDRLARKCGTAGRELLAQVAMRDRVLHRAARFAGHVAGPAPAALPDEPVAPGLDMSADVDLLAQTASADDAREFIRCWCGSGRLHDTLP